MKMIEALKGEMKIPLKKSRERQTKNWKKSINPLEKAKKKQAGKGNGSRLEN